MGDRATVAIEQGDGTRVYLYTHWDGHILPSVVAKALAHYPARWGDHMYLARIVFSEMISNDLYGETGFGIGTSEPGDVQHPTIILDPDQKTITIGDDTWDFESYIEKKALKNQGARR